MKPVKLLLLLASLPVAALAQLVPDSFPVPTSYIGANYKLVPLGPAVAALDYQAYMSSIDHIRKTQGGNWPRPDLTMDDQSKDMAGEKAEWDTRKSFPFAVLTLDGAKELGCFYLRPSSKEGFDVVATMWVTKDAFDRALRIDPKAFKARYFLGLAAEQDGRRSDAAKIWRALLDGAPAGAPWLNFVRESLARVDPSAVPLGPGAADVAAANEMSPEQRNELVRGMVERLALRLKEQGSDVDGWSRLLRAYMVLGEPDKARAAAGDARRALAGEPDKVRMIEELIKGLGLEG